MRSMSIRYRFRLPVKWVLVLELLGAVIAVYVGIRDLYSQSSHYLAVVLFWAAFIVFITAGAYILAAEANREERFAGVGILFGVIDLLLFFTGSSLRMFEFALSEKGGLLPASQWAYGISLLLCIVNTVYGELQQKRWSTYFSGYGGR
jgi:hypothetical protein